ncbi:hypothetical protein C8Q78DRAFT_1074148 [Trametes maxima]|nr:hypothetical protein C8Q78DRAFT_1074147 [Trametes maxima]KAI0677452.1 hypothetical protein C8Q78DRAFT_1074148 [Trametes maxima]
MFYLPSPPILDCLHPYKAHLALATAGPLPPSTPLLSVPPSDVVVQADLFALTRPPPVHPPALPLNLPAQLLSNATNVLLSPVLPAEAVGSPQRHQGLLEKRSFRQRMDDKLKEEWDTSRATWDAKLRGEAQKRENKWRIDHSFFIWHWRKDGEQPTRLCVQGVQTLPNFTLAQDPSVMTRLDITKDDEIDMYQPRYGLWQTQAVNEAFTITPKQTLLFRSVGVKSCPLFDILRAEVTRKAAYGLPLTEPQAVQVTIVAPKPLRTPKRKHTDDVASMQVGTSNLAAEGISSLPPLLLPGSKRPRSLSPTSPVHDRSLSTVDGKRPAKIPRMDPEWSLPHGAPLALLPSMPVLEAAAPVRQSSTTMLRDLEQAQLTAALEASLEEAAREEAFRREMENTEHAQLTTVLVESLEYARIEAAVRHKNDRLLVAGIRASLSQASDISSESSAVAASSSSMAGSLSASSKSSIVPSVAETSDESFSSSSKDSSPCAVKHEYVDVDVIDLTGP